jgi:hypothetical protein
MRNHVLRTSVLLGAFLLPVISFAQGLSGPSQCEGGLADAIAYLHRDPGPNACAGAANNSPQVQQFFNRLATVPSPSQQAIYATLINGLAAAGVWSQLDVLCVAGVDNATTLTNLVQSSYTGTLVGTPSFASFIGYSIGGSFNYVDTGFNPTSPGLNYQQNGAFLAAWNLASDAQPVALLRTVANVNIEIWPAYANGSAYFMVNNAGSVEDLVASSSSSGWFYVQRTGPNALALYQNDTPLGSATTGSTTPENNDIVIDYGATHDFVWAAWAFGGNLTAGQKTSLYNLVHAYLVAVGATS